MSTDTKFDLDSYAVAGGTQALHERIAAAMADAIYANDPTGPAWMVESARDHVLEMINGVTTGGVTVSACGLHLLAGYILYLEQMVALQTPRGAA